MSKKTVNKAALPALGLSFGIAGSMIFWEPSKNFVRAHPVGQAFANVLGPETAFWVFFLSAAPDVAALIMFATINASQKFKNTIKECDTSAQRVLTVTSVLALTALQSIQFPAGAYGTGGKLFDIIATGVGGLPNAFFVATNVLQEDAVQLFRKLDYLWVTTRHYLRPNMACERRRQQYQLHDLLMRRATAAQWQLRQKKIAAPINSMDNLLTQLDALFGIDDAGEKLESWTFCLGKKAIQGVALVTGFAVMALAHSFNMIGNVMPLISALFNTDNPVIDVLGGMFLSFPMLYMFYKLTVVAAGDAYDVAWSILYRQPINKLGYQLNPRIKTAVLVIGSVWSSVSFHTFLALLQRNYHGPLRNELAVSISVWAVLFHVSSLLHCTEEVLILLSMHSKNIKKHNTIGEFRLIQKIKRQSPDKLITLLGGLNDEARCKVLGARGVALFNSIECETNKAINADKNLSDEVVPLLMP